MCRSHLAFELFSFHSFYGASEQHKKTSDTKKVCRYAE